MQRTKKPDTSMGGDIMENPGINCHSCSSTREQRFHSVSGVYEDILNISPQLSYHNPTIDIERRLHDRNSMSFQERTSGYTSRTSIASTETTASESVVELVKEISALELEVIHLERYLLSLYRTAFDQYLPRSSTAAGPASRSPVECHAGRLRHDSTIQISHDQATHSISPDPVVDKSCHSQSLERVEESASNCRHAEHSPAHDLAFSSELKNDIPKSVSGHRSLADHLGASITDHVPEISCRLSEDIIRCISAIYCKLANPPAQHVEQMASPTPSASSSSTFSPQDPCDNWSPQCHYEATASPSQSESLEVKSFQYSGVVEIPQIHIDGDRFGYASQMLNIFSSLIRHLEKIDPRKLEHDEQLAFWINIHNALVMHAFLAYGLHENHMKSTYSILKAAYNVGGHSINAYVIRSSILGCRTHRPALWLHSLFSPAVKFMNGNGRHPYALDRPEPLAYFALCSGACSDPPVRLYTAKGIYQELELAKTEFIQVNVSVRKEKNIVLPKILYYYAKDAYLELSGLVEMVCSCMPDAQRKAAIRECLKRKLDKCVEWSPCKSAFKYLVHRDLAEQ
ncbi:uncharacterized protein LOC103713877 isoform X3 [Phoenix dactylifera]|nr:uncharacterized protein LOC103713877 isoform X3 [Phoenix dactylifera]XP_038987335.1 uncharacterized protein LOC103713877 isoform X3 [Phoenix dactylifera]XP_038987336.1 uncharacterized protein LOC103713877 isoform X3 [Phoenix dactylifera]XP_038987337.1 uncharacterized protein LOC103713877 isoform X3 [Phoenix dactylifera]XP_038987338.1 uncharacterized protein LOC103713877 isoform X3 [Phoenix dactylifera]